MKQILLHVTEEEKVLAVLDEGVLSDISVEKAEETDLVGRVYKGVIRNVVPSINGMFIDIGIGKNGFLRTKDILSKEPHTEGASVLVQVEKDSTETKGPLLTEKISFAGKYAVALLATDYIGISKKIRSEEKRASLRAMGARYMSFRYGSHRAHRGRKGGDGRASARSVCAFCRRRDRQPSLQGGEGPQAPVP